MTIDASDAGSTAVAMPTRAEALGFWFRLGRISFGDPTGQIGITAAVVGVIVELARFRFEVGVIPVVPGCGIAGPVFQLGRVAVQVNT